MAAGASPRTTFSGSDEDAAPAASPSEEPVAVTRWAKLFGNPIHGLAGDVLQDVDGVAVRLYHFLWSRQGGAEPTRTFRLPDTVVYKYRLPIAWFFTGRGGEARLTPQRTRRCCTSALAHACRSPRRAAAAAQAAAQRGCAEDHRRLQAAQGARTRALRGRRAS